MLLANPRPVVLMVDDNPIDREVVGDLLEQLGFDGVLLATPFSVATALTEHQPDIALIDLSMPALSGSQLIRTVKRYRDDFGSPQNRCLLVLYSDRPEHELSALARDSSADGFVPKSKGLPYLARKLQELLQQKQSSVQSA